MAEYDYENTIEPVKERIDPRLSYKTAFISGERAVSMLDNGFTVYHNVAPLNVEILNKPDLDRISAEGNYEEIFSPQLHDNKFYARYDEVVAQAAIEEIALAVENDEGEISLDLADYSLEEYAADDELDEKGYRWNDGQNTYMNVEKMLVMDYKEHTNCRDVLIDYYNETGAAEADDKFLKTQQLIDDFGDMCKAHERAEKQASKATEKPTTKSPVDR